MKENFCPLLKKTCIGSKCTFSVKLRGNNPNTGEPMDEEACAVAWLPLLLVGNTQAANEVGAAVESFRNEAVNAAMSNPKPRLIQ